MFFSWHRLLACVLPWHRLLACVLPYQISGEHRTLIKRSSLTFKRRATHFHRLLAMQKVHNTACHPRSPSPFDPETAKNHMKPGLGNSPLPVGGHFKYNIRIVSSLAIYSRDDHFPSCLLNFPPLSRSFRHHVTPISECAFSFDQSASQNFPFRSVSIFGRSLVANVD